MHVQIKHSLAHLQDLIPFSLAGIKYIHMQTQHSKLGLNLVDVLQNTLFVHAFGYMFEPTIANTGWCIVYS